MKRKITICLLAASLLSVGVLAGCGKKNNTSDSSIVAKEFSFTLSLASGLKTMAVGETTNIAITEENNEEGTARAYIYSSTKTDIATISEQGLISALAEGETLIRVKETTSGKTASLNLIVTNAVKANGGYNYASLAGEEAVNTRTEILGKLEKYAMDNHLTGITLFENGGYVKYSDRVTLPTTNYIVGYGFGLLSEGSVDKDMDAEENPNYKRYLHSATSSDPKTINARNDTGSQVSDLEGYISSSYWGTKMNATKDQYIWYPVLAKDKVTYNGQQSDFSRPIPIFNNQEVAPNTNPEPNPLGLYKTWRIYVKTSEIKYQYAGSPWNGTNFNNRSVALADYEFAYRLLLTGSHNLKRGPEMAADQTYGIFGAQSYNTKTKEASDEQALALWNSMKSDGRLGIATGTDPVNGDYIQLTLVNAIDRFTAMYALSSNLVSPLPEDFIRAIGSGSVKEGAPLYGTFNNSVTAPEGHKNNILDYTLSIGPYMLQEWVKNQTIVFKKNTTWNEPGRYNIAGVKLVVVPDATTEPDAIYNLFNDKQLDSCGIPTLHISEEMGQPGVYKTRGTSTFKLNVNSCDQATWDKLFGDNGKINKGSQWDVKPWMSNDNFLKGLYYSIDRKAFAEKRGVQPSINYFSDAYLNDPENGKSYNDSDAHKEAVAAYEVKDSKGESLYGYSKDKAIQCFKTAVKELTQQGKLTKGSKSKPTEIHIHIKWMYQTDITEYGDDIKEFFEIAFNDSHVSDGTVKLIVDQDAVTNWQDVYNEYLMKGQFDLGFGAISGNTYNPLNFLQVLKSDNESGFTLNWGDDTSAVNEDNPIIYQGKIWSFDSLWAVADHGGVVEDGRSIKPVKKSFLEYSTNNFYNGTTFYVPTTFFNDENGTVKFEVSRVSLSYSKGSEDLQYTMENGKIKIVLSQEQAQAINALIIEAEKLEDPKLDEDKKDHTPFKVDNYGKYWIIDVYYTLSIKDTKTGEWGAPSESVVTAAKNEGAWIDQ